MASKKKGFMSAAETGVKATNRAKKVAPAVGKPAGKKAPVVSKALVQTNKSGGR